MSDSADLFFADLLMVPCFLMYFRTFFFYCEFIFLGTLKTELKMGFSKKDL